MIDSTRYLTRDRRRPSHPLSPGARGRLAALPLTVALFGAAQFFPAVARAQEACGDSSCPKGYTCETGAAACPAICIVPASGEGCEPCTEKEYQYCVPAECQVDGDCGDGMRCAERPQYDCGGATDVAPSDPGCDPDAPDCAARVAERSACTEIAVRMCTPQWQLPCTSASDCGAGFTCERAEVCSAPACDREAADADDACAAAQVTCEPSEETYCRPVETACNSDADCESGWSCRESASSGCAVSPDAPAAAAADSICAPVESTKTCAPPYTDLPGYGGRAEVGSGVAVEDSSNEISDGDLGAPALANDDSVSAASNGSGGGCALGRAQTTRSAWPFALLALSSWWSLRRRRLVR